MACMVWGDEWSGGGTQAVVEVINSGSAKDRELMQLLRALFFVKAQFEISLLAEHIPGHQNGLADAISRNHMHLVFFTGIVGIQCPNQGSDRPASNPAARLDISELFTNDLQQVWHPQRGTPTPKILFPSRADPLPSIRKYPDAGHLNWHPAQVSRILQQLDMKG